MARSTTPVSVSRPTVLDYFFLLAGVGLSLFLMEFHPLKVEASDLITNDALRGAIAYLPQLLRLPEGVILVFPVFFIAQFALGRCQGLTAGEWLWLLSWFGTAMLTALAVCNHYQFLPDFVQTNLLLIRFTWYIGFGLAMAGVALFLFIVGFFGAVRPWTHQLALALALWTVAPLAGILTLTKMFL